MKSKQLQQQTNLEGPMKAFKHVYSILLAAVLIVSMPILNPTQTASAQATLTRTTLAANVAGQPQPDNTIIVTSATGFTANYLILVDNEIMVINSGYVSGTSVRVQRGQYGTATVAHNNAAQLYMGQPQYFTRNRPSGRCTSTTSSLATPVVFVPQQPISAAVTLYACDTVANLWYAYQESPPQSFARPRHALSNPAAAAMAYTATIDDELISVTSNTGQAVTVTLPCSTVYAGKQWTINDESGAAGTGASTIWITPVQGGVGSASSNINRIVNGFGAIQVYSNGTNCYVISHF